MWVEKRRTSLDRLSLEPAAFTVSRDRPVSFRRSAQKEPAPSEIEYRGRRQYLGMLNPMTGSVRRLRVSDSGV
jgi:hypothetical protein